MSGFDDAKRLLTAQAPPPAFQKFLDMDRTKA